MTGAPFRLPSGVLVSRGAWGWVVAYDFPLTLDRRAGEVLRARFAAPGDAALERARRAGELEGRLAGRPASGLEDAGARSGAPPSLPG